MRGRPRRPLRMPKELPRLASRGVSALPGGAAARGWLPAGEASASPSSAAVTSASAAAAAASASAEVEAEARGATSSCARVAPRRPSYSAVAGRAARTLVAGSVFGLGLGLGLGFALGFTLTKAHTHPVATT